MCKCMFFRQINSFTLELVGWKANKVQTQKWDEYAQICIILSGFKNYMYFFPCCFPNTSFTSLICLWQYISCIATSSGQAWSTCADLDRQVHCMLKGKMAPIYSELEAYRCPNILCEQQNQGSFVSQMAWRWAPLWILWSLVKGWAHAAVCVFIRPILFFFCSANNFHETHRKFLLQRLKLFCYIFLKLACELKSY